MHDNIAQFNPHAGIRMHRTGLGIFDCDSKKMSPIIIRAVRYSCCASCRAWRNGEGS